MYGVGDEDSPPIPSVSLDSIPTWQSTLDTTTEQASKKSSTPSRFICDPSLNSIIRIWKGDIWTLAVDAIVNSTNETLSETQGVSAAITEHAGPEFMAEVEKLEGCRTGEAKITHGFGLPARYSTHTSHITTLYSHCVVRCVALRCAALRVLRVLRALRCCVACCAWGVVHCVGIMVCGVADDIASR